MNVFFVNSFLNCLKEFLVDLKVLIPVTDDILAFQKTIELAEWSVSSKKAIVDGFMYYIYPFYINILLRKESFFLDTKNIENNDRFKGVDEQTQTENYDKMFQLKGVWEQLTEHNKMMIWDYFHALIINGARASNNQDILSWVSQHEEDIKNARILIC